MRALIHRLRAYLALRRERHDPDLADAFRERRERISLHAWWMAEACDPEAARIARRIAQAGRPEMAVMG